MGMGGIQRVFYIPQFLKKLGWNVMIYTPNPPGSYIKDNTFSDKTSLSVTRTPCPDPLHIIGNRGSGMGGGKRDTLSFPDNKVFWLPFLYRALANVDVIVTSSPPFSLLLLGQFKGNVPWVIDFRDPWVGSYIGEYLFSWEEKLAITIEKYSCEKASLVVTVTNHHQHSLCNRYPQCRKKIHLIRNGYSEKEFPAQLERKRDKDIVITYMGTFNKLLPPQPIFKGLEELFNKKPEMKSRIVFKHIGHSTGFDLNQLGKIPGIKEIIRTGYLPHKEALTELIDSDILILLGAKGPQDKAIIPSKLYEYLKADIPIIAITDNKEIEGLIGNSGLRCDYSPEAIAETLLRIIDNPHSFKQADNYREFSWENLAKKYSNLLSSVL